MSVDRVRLGKDLWSRYYGIFALVKEFWFSMLQTYLKMDRCLDSLRQIDRLTVTASDSSETERD